MLRTQGVSDVELDELRRTGSIQRADGASSIQVEMAHAGDPTAVSMGAVHVDGITMMPGQIPPEAIERLRQFHTFMPKDAVHQLETMSGQDIDGDGVVGVPGTLGTAGMAGVPAANATTGSNGLPAAVDSANARTAQHDASGAMPGQGPFVEKHGGAKLLPITLAIGAIAVVAYFVTR